ncbi:MAG: hypothetical protein FJW34_20290 [Acidobacteria bacterium]|nr:hypothetical protein [Acidobacteriota bacterium]
MSCSSFETTRLTELFTPDLLRHAAADLDAAAAAAESAAIRRRVDFYRQGLRYTEITVQAVLAAKAVDFRPEPGAMPPEERARQRHLAAAALETCRRRLRFIEELKNDYVLPYFWARYNNEHRADFLPVARLEALLASLGR